MKKPLPITTEQVASLQILAQNAALELAAFVERPEHTLRRWVSRLGFDVEIVEAADSAPFESSEIPLGKLVEQPTRPSSARPSARPSSPAPAQTGLPPIPRKASPREIEGTTEMLGGRKGVISRPAGPDSYFVLLDDGAEVVLSTRLLHLAGCERPENEPDAPVLPAPAVPTIDEATIEAQRIAGWKDLIGERQGRIVGPAGPGCFTVEFEDGQNVTLPEAALPYAGCEVPRP